MGATDAAAAMLPLTASKDPVIANVAINALAALSAIDAPLAAVRGLVRRHRCGRAARASADPSARGGHRVSSPRCRTRSLRRAAARSSRRWRGCTIARASGAARLPSGGARVPTPPGPTTIRSPGKRAPAFAACSLAALLETAAGGGPRDAFTRLASDLQRNRVLPPGGAELVDSAGSRSARAARRRRACAGRQGSARRRCDDRPAARADRARADRVPRRRRQNGRRRRTADAACRRHPQVGRGRSIAERRGACIRVHRACVRRPGVTPSIDRRILQPGRANARGAARTGLDSIHLRAGARREH